MNLRCKKYIIAILLILSANILFGQGGIVSFYKIATLKKAINAVSLDVKKALASNEFKVIGEYKPASDTNKYVIVFTRQDLMDIAFGSKNRGALAAALRVGLLDDGKGNVDVSLLNPQYLFYGYLRDNINNNEVELNQINLDVISALSSIGESVLPYITSSLSDRQLMEYRYMLRNPSFDDPVVLKDFSSFDEGLKKIQTNLKARKGRTVKVYEIIDNQKQIAIFGVGLWGEKGGEPDFLNLLGASHLAAMPYEIILSGKKATILHGKFRFPFYWSDLSMIDYTKIYRTPREVQETMTSLTQ